MHSNEEIIADAIQAGIEAWKLNDQGGMTSALDTALARLNVGTPSSTVLQPWLASLTMMQQTVLLTAIRGPDGTPKYGPTKMLLRWYRRCVLLSAMDRSVLTNPMDYNGGSFTGPSITRGTLEHEMIRRREVDAHEHNSDILEHGFPLTLSVEDDRSVHAIPLDELIALQESDGGWEPLMNEIVGQYLRELDALPHHFQLHFLHAAQIVGYKHPDLRIRAWWRETYERLVHDMHLWPETEAQMDLRLGDNRDQWLARNDAATVA